MKFTKMNVDNPQCFFALKVTGHCDELAMEAKAVGHAASANRQQRQLDVVALLGASFLFSPRPQQTGKCHPSSLGALSPQANPSENTFTVMPNSDAKQQCPQFTIPTITIFCYSGFFLFLFLLCFSSQSITVLAVLKLIL